jgi:hypothetical protein
MRSDFKARRGLRAFVATVALSLAIGGALAGGAAAASPPPTNHTRAQRGAQWLANQIKHNGGFVKAFGVADVSDTAYAVIGMRAAGVDKPATDLALKYLKSRLGAALQSGGHDAPGPLAYYILAAVADGANPHQFGGTSGPNNLVARLFATQRTSGANLGLFGSQDPTYDGAFRQGLALAALKAAGVVATDTRLTRAIGWLTRQQCANGLWEAFRANTATACPAADPNTFTGPDTNSTALAVQGLAAWSKFPNLALTQQSLKTVQSANAGFPFVAAPNQPSDPDSTALVIQALIAEHSAPATAWNKGTLTPFSALAGFQIGCTSPDFGAFFFSHSSPTANVFATVQAVPAMDSKSLPVAASTASSILPLTRC